MDRKNVWSTYNASQLTELHEINEKYKRCLDEGKTERECVKLTIQMAEAAGYQDLKEVLKKGTPLKAGDKVYTVCMDKMIALFHMGEEPISAGMNILGAHIDSPRIDIKQNPLYENEDFAYLDTHYYGGIKKYQWVAQPMAIHGVVVKKDGTKIEVVIGEKEEDPVFCITDLLIHLSGKQLEKKAATVIEGEGLDRSMILAYGQDDRVCAFTSLFAMLDAENLVKTGCCLLVDKEEVGSVGATGMHSRVFENTVAELVALNEGESELKVRRALANSRMLSSDVSAGYDPMYADAFEKRSSAFLANGLSLNKFTGSRGKSGSNDANAEYIGKLRKVFDDAEVAYQFAELGKVDVGGGGTIAYIMANYGMEVIDSGVAVLNMHAPYEVSSKADVYEAVKGYKAFLAMN